MHVGEQELHDDRVYFIAEAGINHNGELDRAREMIDVAAAAGSDAVKFQSFRPEELVPPDDDSYERYKQHTLDRDDHLALQSHARERDVTFLSTPFGPESADLLDSIDVPAIKIGSGELTNHPLLQQVASFGRPLIVSTGMATLSEIFEAREAIRESNPDVAVALLVCTSAYPTPIEHANLRAIRTLEEHFSHPIGFSDHTMEVETPALAVAAGARIVEKHFTLDRSLPGPDHEIALEPDELERAIDLARFAATANGDGQIDPTVDAENRTAFRKSLHATRTLEAGDTLTREVVGILRPATGLAPTHLESVLGATLRRPIDEGEPLTENHVDVDDGE